MAGQPITSINQTITGSDTGVVGGAFSTEGFSKISIEGTVSSISAGILTLYLQSQLLDGTWVTPDPSTYFFRGSSVEDIPLVEINTPFNSARIAWNFPAADSAVVDISVFGIS